MLTRPETIDYVPTYDQRWIDLSGGAATYRESQVNAWFQELIEGIESPIRDSDESQLPPLWQRLLLILLGAPLLLGVVLGLMWLCSAPHAHLLGQKSSMPNRILWLFEFPNDALVQPWQYIGREHIWVNRIWRGLLCLAWYPFLLFLSWVVPLLVAMSAFVGFASVLTRSRAAYWVSVCLYSAIVLTAFAVWYGPPLVLAIWRVPVIYLFLLGLVLKRFMPEESSVSSEA